MTEQKATRDMIDVLIEALAGADRVVIETENALGEMDSHILHAPEILRAWNTRSGNQFPRKDKTMSDDLVRAAEVLLEHERKIVDAMAFAKHSRACDGGHALVGHAAAQAAFYAMCRALTAIKESKDD